MLNSHTHCQVAPANANAKTWQRVCLPNRTTKSTDKPTDEKEHRSDNSVYVAIAGVVVNRRSVLLKNFVLNRKVIALNPLLHIHAKRYKLLGILRDKILFLKAIEIIISTIPKIIPAKKSLKLNPVVGVIFSLREWFSSFKASRV